MKRIKFQYSDGGRYNAGYNTIVGDCVTRAIAIVSRISYIEVYESMNKFISEKEGGTKARKGSCVPLGIHIKTLKKIMRELGAKWYFTNSYDDIPRKGKVILNVPNHVCAIIDGIIYDTFDIRETNKRIYGYWKIC